MDYQQLLIQRRTHPAWRLLAADHAPMIASFLHAAFIAPNVRAMPRQQLAVQLDDHLYRLHDVAGEIVFPKTASSYLDDWASDERGWLRKFYRAGEDDAHYDLASSTEQAIDWLRKLDRCNFIGTESRLMTVFDLLHQIVDGSELDPRARIAALKRKKAEIDVEIAQIGAGRIDLMDATQVRERFLHMAATARELVSDFRAVDQNFRALDRQVREQIATWDGSKGALQQAIFGQRDLISETDEGKSFKAFWDLLMSPARQDELSALLARAAQLAPVRELESDGRLQRIHDDLMEAGQVTQRTVARLSAQLRRYLDDQAWLENRRIMQIMRDIEQRALRMRGQIDERAFMDLAAPAPLLPMPMERSLYAPPFKPKITQQILVDDGEAVSADALFEQVHVDPARLRGNVRRALQTHPQISLADLTATYPLEQGLGELAAYLKLATEDGKAAIDDDQTEMVRWTDQHGRVRVATLPLIIYSA
ncbi:DUF3375 domain-containing protein [Massilia sp. DWR3-1-1]|uniref:DUF3375 domain-containing protein n=1 Tax=Massilia sp. DWR3-1-1 TaxID=2804559 RepID=UPI003CF2516D